MDKVNISIKTLIASLIVVGLIAGIYASGVVSDASTEGDLVAEYRFDTGVGDTVYDTSGGTVYGIRKGYDSGNLNFQLNQWGGNSNSGELDITCPSGDSSCKFTHKGQTYSGNEINNINNGIATDGQDKGTRYVLYSQESVHNRFKGNPHSSNADHFIAVNYDNGWEYDANDNGGDTGFTPRSSDLLIAEFNGDGSEDSGSEGSIAYSHAQDKNHGSMSGADWARGIEGRALDLKNDGDQVVIPDDSTLEGQKNGITVAFWFYSRQDNVGDWSVALGKGAFANDPYSMIIDNIQSDTFRFNPTLGDQSSNYYRANIDNIPHRDWTHLVMRYDPSTGDMQVFRDGKLKDTTSVGNIDLARNSKNLQFGEGGSGGYINGKIDNSLIYNRPLNNSEIRSLYKSGSWRTGSTTEKQDNTKILDMSFQHVRNGQVLEKSGENNHGTVNNGASQVGAVECQVGRCFSFDESGGGGNGQSIETDPASGLNNEQITAMAWIKPKPSTDSRAPIIRADQFYFQHYSDDRLASYWYGWNKEGYHTSPSGSVPTGEWSHVAVTWDNSSGVSFYVDGQLTNQISNTGPGDPNNWIRIGREGSNRRFNGKIDQAKVYNQSLSSQKIWKIYTQGRDKNSLVGPVAAWKFDSNTLKEGFESGSSGNNICNSDRTWDRKSECMVYDSATAAEGSLSAFMDSGSPGPDGQALMQKKIHNSDKKLSKITAWYRETSSSTGHGISFRNSTGGRVLGFYTNNPEFGVYDQTGFNGGQVSGDLCSSNYDTWYQVNFTLDWSAGTYSFQRSDGCSGSGYSLGSQDGIASVAVEPADDENWEANSVYGWVDDIRADGVSVDFSGEGKTGNFYGYDGPGVGGPKRVSGKKGEALEFDGSDDYIDIDGLERFDDDNEVSISAWVYREGTTERADIVNAGKYDTLLFVDNNEIGSFYIHDGSNSHIVNGKKVPEGEWHHMTGTYDGSALKVYQNGVLENSKNVDINIRDSGSTTVISDSSLPFEGKIDDVRIYPYALDQQQVNQVMNAGAVNIG